MKEFEIRPKKIFDEYLSLAKQDAQTFFSGVVRQHFNCPACNRIGKNAFQKDEFEYDLCQYCATLYVNPRPLAAAFQKYYSESNSSKYWASTFYSETAESRRVKIWQPRAKLIIEKLKAYGSKNYLLFDIGGGYGIFSEEIYRLCGIAPTVIEPAQHLADICREKNLPVIQKFLEHIQVEEIPVGPKAFVSFELFEHLHSPDAFLENLNNLMSSNDLFIFTTLSSNGVDIQALWDNSQSVSPPHHLNFFNPDSIQILLNRLGFETLEVTTPGQLDLDILVNNEHLIKDRFWKTFIRFSSVKQRGIWQQLISSSGWSSHMMVICRKV